VTYERSCGILLHPTSLPSRYGIGDLGESAYEFVDFLQRTGQSLWQVLPLGPTGYGDSPYQSFSAFAGNPLLISPDVLLKEGFLTPTDVEDVPAFPIDRVDYGPVIEFKKTLLRRSFEHFEGAATRAQRAEFAEFCMMNQAWLADFALFMALKDHFGGVAWNAWAADIATREPAAIAHYTQTLATQIRFHRYAQFQFFRQWSAVKQYANDQAIRVIGDIPIFVAYDSADTWANPDLFCLDERGAPTVVAGVPPDYFSETGQLWGNPLYRWNVMAKRGYAWWIERLRATFRLFDMVRLDHFRGFEAYWEVPADEDTAINGRWVKGPGTKLFRAAEKALGELPIIAEDLGVITPEVEALLEQTGFPRMKVLVFAFDTDATNEFLPHHHHPNCIVYTGTHDNDTTRGWFERCNEEVRDFALDYLGTDGCAIHWDFIRLAFGSVANMAVVPMQDVLGLGNEARMNFPSIASGNWQWRLVPGLLTDEVMVRLRRLTKVYGRAKAREQSAQSGQQPAASNEQSGGEKVEADGNGV
jgi:4-alpha-glucanotransferase